MMVPSQVAAEPGHRFPKSQKLFGDKPVGDLFANGQGFVRFPFRVVFVSRDRRQGEAPLRMMVSVSKRKFKRAVARNRVKRLVREAWRLRKQDLEATLASLGSVSLHVAFVFVGNEMPEFGDVLQAVEASIKKLSKTASANSANNEVAAL